MIFTNIASTAGLIVSSFFFYTFMFLGFSGPGYHPFLVNSVILISFAVSYFLSLTGARTMPSRIMGLLFSFLGLIVTFLFALLVLLERTYFPSYWGISGAYIQFLLFLVLVYFWIKHR